MIRDNDQTVSETLRMAVDICTAYVGNHSLKKDELAPLLQSIHDTILSATQDTAPVNRTPAVPVGKSITPNHLICLEDGKKLRMLKRYLRTQYGMTPEDYRRKWGLPADYPMTAPNYSKRRSQLAKDIGLGRAALPGRSKAVKTAAKKRKGGSRSR